MPPKKGPKPSTKPSATCVHYVDTSNTKWHPKTQCYNYNYGIGMNYYQPMIKYIDQKLANLEAHYLVPPPHLPWSEELGLEQYDPHQIPSRYTDRELDEIARKTERSAKLRMVNSHSGSGFVLSNIVGASRLTTQLQREERKKNKLVKEIRKLQTKMRDDIDYHPDRDRALERELKSQQRFLRGKSAGSIEAALLAKSRNTIAHHRDEDLRVAQLAESLATSHISQSMSKVSGRCRRTHVKVMDERITSQLEESIHRPLECLSEELRGFDRRATHKFIDQRYRR